MWQVSFTKWYLPQQLKLVPIWWKIGLAGSCGYARSGTWGRNSGSTTPESVKGWWGLSWNFSKEVSKADFSIPHGRSTGWSERRQSSGRHSIGVKSRWAIYPGRLKRQMWLLTAQRLRYTLARFQGERLIVELWIRHPWKRIIKPALAWGLTIPPFFPPDLSTSWRIN